MSKKNSDDSSSSEDETLQYALKESTDHTFFQNADLSTTKSRISDISKETGGHELNKSRTNSMRKNVEQKSKFSMFGVTPTFQNYVAKKLDEILDKSVEVDNQVENNTVNKKESENDNCGIKLLNSSAKFITAEQIEESQKPQKRKIEATINDEENLLKCKQVAVDPEWILSKAETKAWSSKRKGLEFKYKRLKSGILVEIS